MSECIHNADNIASDRILASSAAGLWPPSSSSSAARSSPPGQSDVKCCHFTHFEYSGSTQPAPLTELSSDMPSVICPLGCTSLYSTSLLPYLSMPDSDSRLARWGRGTQREPSTVNCHQPSFKASLQQHANRHRHTDVQSKGQITCPEAHVAAATTTTNTADMYAS